MTIKRAEFLTGCEIRRLPSEPDRSRFAAFEAGECVAEAGHFDERTALKRLVERIYARHCREVLAEYGYRCACCRRTSRTLEFHHKRPRSLGGTHRRENLEPLCWTCHRLAQIRRRRRI